MLRELMFETSCPILNLTSERFPPSIHGHSTTILAGFFSPQFLSLSLSLECQWRLCQHVYFGKPLLRSANDGMPKGAEGKEVDVSSSSSRPSTPASVFGLEDDDDDDDDDDASEASEASDASDASETTGSAHASSKFIRQRWTKEEDARLMDCVRRHGLSWRKISFELRLGSEDRIRNRYFRLVGRLPTMRTATPSPKQCRRRNAWTEEEDALIVNAAKAARFAKSGKTTWKEIAKCLPRRTPNGVRNRYDRISLAVRNGGIAE